MKILKTRVIEIPDSFVFNTIKFNKTKGSGEAKLYIGQISEKEKLDEFFIGTKIKFDKKNLIDYMYKTMLIHEYQFFGEYKNTSQEEWEKILKEVNVIDELEFIIDEKIETFISGNRYYIRVQGDLFKRIFRKIALPLITKLTLKLTDTNEVIFELDIKENLEELKEKDYRELFNDYFEDAENYKNEFKLWLSKQISKQAKKILSEKTQNDYIKYLDTTVPSHLLEYQNIDVNIFEITNIVELESYYDLYKNELKEIDKKTSQAYSSALTNYINFQKEYKYKQRNVNLEINDSFSKFESSKKINKPHNRIVYGSPGTGKSYQLSKEVEVSFPKLVETKIKNKRIDNKTIKYWVATCGEDNEFWEEFYSHGKFAIGWSELGDLKSFDSLSSINEKFMERYDYGKNNRTINYFKYMKTSMKKDDIIIIRKGRKNLIEGYGIITGDYEYDSTMPEDFYHTIPVEWKKKESIALEDYSKNLPWATISTANDELVSLLSKNKYIEKEIETENIESEVVDRVTFYDGYTHGQFVGTYKPVPEGDTITYKYIPGPFMKQLVESYKNPTHNFCLIIEEINRAKADKVFGNIFQLLDRDSNGKSEYYIAVSADQETYLKKELEDEYDEILKDLLDKGLYIPKNLYIWATMNSADQGVYPMDSAFKRRWHFEHIGLDQNEGEFGDKDKTYELTYQKKSETEGTEKKTILWNNFRKIINENLLRDNVSEDRLLAPFFIKENNFKSKEDNFYELDEKVFKNKILMYLFDDVLRHKRKTILFDENIKSFSQLIKACEDGKVIFSKEIIEKLDTEKITKEKKVEIVKVEG